VQDGQRLTAVEAITDLCPQLNPDGEIDWIPFALAPGAEDDA